MTRIIELKNGRTIVGAKSIVVQRDARETIVSFAVGRETIRVSDTGIARITPPLPARFGLGHIPA